jgi:uncharacterized membrane protein HdeD (DUF308 family)
MAAATQRQSNTSDTAPDGRLSAVLARNWWAMALRGIAAILFGLIALVAPGAVLISLAIFFAAYLLVDGIFGIVSAIRAAQKHERWGLLLAEGVLNIVVGIIAFLFPVGAVLTFVLMTAAWALMTGGLMVGAAFKLGRAHGRGWMVLSGAVSILFGLALVMAPIIGAVVLTWWFGGYAIAFGALLLILAFKLRKQHQEEQQVTTVSGPATQSGPT